jgi:protein-tyrosine phosphatase
MAAAFLRRDAEARGRRLDVASAGVWAREGMAVSEGSVAAMARVGVDISDHVSRPVTDDLLDRSDLVVTMEWRHVVEIVSTRPDVLARTFTLRELVELVPDASLPVDAADGSWLDSVGEGRSARSVLGRDEWDVEDPIGRSRSHYRRCAAELDGLCSELSTALWGPPP